MSRERISACLIVQDEQVRLPAALASVSFCDEIVVVDGGSEDETVALARAAGATVIENPWPGFSRQRNVALAAAGGDWVLELDADERVSPRLRASIEALLENPSRGIDVAVCPLRHRFLGALLGPSAKYPAYRTRIFRRGAYEHDQSRPVHEGVEPRERPIVLAGDLEHELADTAREALADAWRYAKLESSHIAPPRGPLAYLLGIAIRPTAKLAYRLALEGGWRDGWRGLFKIALDAGSDALVWSLVLARATNAGSAPNPDAPPPDADAPSGAHVRPSDGQHFGRRPTGPPKVVAVAGPGRAERAARAWLAQLAAAGVDVALIGQGASAAAGASMDLPGQRLRRLAPLQTMRALDLEMQVRTAHAVVPFGPRARLLTGALPGSLRPSIAGVHAGVEPEQALERLRAAVAWR